jgi:O-antigen/teichoic acid export membrane protein
MTESAAGRQPAGRTGLLSQSRWNLLGLACTLAAHFVTIPFVVRWIGLTDFGRAGLVLAISAPLTLIGAVLGQALVREVSSRADQATGRVVLALAIRLGWLCAAVTALGVALLGPALADWIGSSDVDGAPLRAAFGWAAAALFAQQMTLVLQGYAMALQDFKRIAQMAAFSGLATLACCLVGARLLPNAIGYLGGVAAAFLTSLAGWCWIYRRELTLRAPAGTSPTEAMRGLLAFGKWQGLAQVAGALGNQIDRYALGALAPVALVGQYNVANRLQEATYMAVMKAGEVLFPYFGSLSKAPVAERQSVFELGCWVLATFCAVLLAPIVPLADPILTAWVGPSVGADTGTLLRTLILGAIVGCGSNVFTYYAMGIGQNAPVAWLSIGYALSTVILTIVLIRSFGPLMAGAGLLLASVGRVAAAMVLTRARFFPALPWRAQMRSTVLPITVGCAMALGLHAIASWEGLGWAALLVAYPLMALLVLVSILGVSSLSPGGRAVVLQALNGLRALRRR